MPWYRLDWMCIQCDLVLYTYNCSLAQLSYPDIPDTNSGLVQILRRTGPFYKYISLLFQRLRSRFDLAKLEDIPWLSSASAICQLTFCPIELCRILSESTLAVTRKNITAYQRSMWFIPFILCKEKCRWSHVAKVGLFVTWLVVVIQARHHG